MERVTRRSANGTGVYATPSGEPVKWEDNRHNVLQKLADYEDLEEQGRLVILPDGMNLRKLLDILTEYSPGCPSEYNLVNRCELSCFECWLAALKGEENDNL